MKEDLTEASDRQFKKEISSMPAYAMRDGSLRGKKKTGAKRSESIKLLFSKIQKY